MKKLMELLGIIVLSFAISLTVSAEDRNIGDSELGIMEYESLSFNEEMYLGEWVAVDQSFKLFLPLNWTIEDLEEKDINEELLFGASLDRSTTLTVMGGICVRDDMKQKYGDILGTYE